MSRSVSSSSSRSVSRAEGFVDARRLHSEDVVKKTLDENVGVLGVATRPKVLDFDARLKERKKAGTRVAAIRVLIVILAAALVSALIWLLLFSSVFRLETSQISVSGGNEWVSEKDVLDIANQTLVLLLEPGNLELQVDHPAEEEQSRDAQQELLVELLLHAHPP